MTLLTKSLVVVKFSRDKQIGRLPWWQIAAPFGRARREGSEVEDLDSAGHVDLDFFEDSNLEITTWTPYRWLRDGRAGPETPVEGDSSTVALLRDLYPMELKSIAA